ncbi:DUF1534 domain-containing protein [Pseudomonas savastanoi pv. phaseolicola]|uniref:DUF1534 domain-containing protein n=1 Tax=Pseudomonas amygdali pv. lachrymans str. M301315 TaxID=629260 RepID=A0AAD0M3T2_PSEAV|nr:DUF1534 domain-containing protein [Pseudomonas amygdali pv. lachrymans str. M301315]MBN3468885.1 DUF1534 domain-containing protein [Pseudomonas savastanoi pv. phaseolicola]PWD04639.1 hypothetical protein CX658_01300 [Pseudomonas amygdali pv. lachrymans]PYD23086.1 DUF1534 domain-containing protein [Pseudomonas savastanoi pv. glycinea]QDW03433.1 DUF1534 domain-containing protein [Pseudomonas sp. KBS0707]QED87467.1 DUF1534 domain-containing protein [Pseudomonas amygdali pv. tabaci str. ATCC 11
MSGARVKSRHLSFRTLQRGNAFRDALRRKGRGAS